MPWATCSTIFKSWPNARTLQNTLSTLPLWASPPNYTSSLNLWLALFPLQQSLRLQYLCLPLLLSFLPQFRPPYLDSRRGQNSLLPLTCLVNEALVEPSSTPVCYICIWPQSSSAIMRKRSSRPLSSSRMDKPQSGPRISFTRRQTPAFFPFSPGLTLSNSSKVSSFWSMWRQIPSTP